MVDSYADSQPRRHGAAGFVGASCNVFVGTVISWLSVPYYAMYIYFAPMVLIDLCVCVVLAAQSGWLGQLGRGMLIGLLSVPLTSAVIWISFLLVW